MRQSPWWPCPSIKLQHPLGPAQCSQLEIVAHHGSDCAPTARLLKKSTQNIARWPLPNERMMLANGSASPPTAHPGSIWWTRRQCGQRPPALLLCSIPPCAVQAPLAAEKNGTAPFVSTPSSTFSGSASACWIRTRHGRAKTAAPGCFSPCSHCSIRRAMRSASAVSAPAAGQCAPLVVLCSHRPSGRRARPLRSARPATPRGSHAKSAFRPMGSVDKNWTMSLAFLRGGPLRNGAYFSWSRVTRASKTNQSRPWHPHQRLISWFCPEPQLRDPTAPAFAPAKPPGCPGAHDRKIAHKHQRTALWMVSLQVAQMAQQRSNLIELAMDITHDIQRSFGEAIEWAHGMAGGSKGCECAAQRRLPILIF